MSHTFKGTPPIQADPYDAARHVGVKLNPGDWVAGRFQIIKQLGRGGFGRVYEARQESMGQRRIALKVLAPRNAREPNAEGRFKQEALLASRLSHPNTITLFDYGATEEGLFYIAMEYLDGETLGMVLRRGAMPIARVEHITLQVLRSLAEAHSIGLIHRDLKPDNIFLCQIFGERDFVKVLDFGLAKIAGVLEERAAKGQLPRNARTDLTLEGLVCGTPEYMAPEQARGIEPLMPACDVYAVGLLIYNMLTGNKPYSGATPVEILQKQVSEPLPALPAIAMPHRIARLMEVATRKNPDERYADASAMLYALMGRLPIDPVSGQDDPGLGLPPAFPRVKTVQFAPMRREKLEPSRAFPVEINIEASRTSLVGHDAGLPPALAAAPSVEPDHLGADHPTPPPRPLVVAEEEELLIFDEPQLAPNQPPRETERFAAPIEPPDDVLEPVTGALPVLDPEATSPGISLSIIEQIDQIEPIAPPAVAPPRRATAPASPAATSTPAAPSLVRTPAPAQTSSAAMLSTQIPMVGRDDEVKHMLGVVRAAAQRRRSRVVLIKGDPGVGKSRLLTEIVRIVRDTSDILVAGSYFRDPNAAPLDGLRRLLSHILGVDPDLAAALSDIAQAEAMLRANLEQLKLVIADGEIRMLATLLGPDEGFSRQVRNAEDKPSPALILFRLRKLLLEIARQQPLFLILEDVQFADPASLDLIRRLAGAIARQDDDPRARPALCLALTIRREATGNDRKDLLELLQFLGRHEGTLVDIVQLQGLSDEACSQLLDALLPLEPELRRRVAEAAHGNPLHALEVVRHMVERRRLVRENERFELDPALAGELSLPDDVAEMLRLRLAQVVDDSEAPEAMQELLYRMAVLGRRVPLELLRATLELEERPWPDELLEKLLRELVHMGLLHLDGHRSGALLPADTPLLRATGSLTFEHGLLHEILLREAESTVAARRLHRKAARAKQRFYDTGRPELAADLAQHLMRAREYAEALPWLVEAASWSQQVGDLQGALSRYTDADRLLTHHSELVHAVPRRLIHQIGLALGHLNLRLGRHGPAQHYLERTFQAWSTQPDHDPDDATPARAHLYLGELAQQLKRYDDARHHLEQARQLGEACQPPALETVQKALIQLGELRLAEDGQLGPTYIRDFDQALERISAEFPLLKARGLQHLGNVALAQGDALTAERYLARARLIVDEVGDPSIRVPIICDLGYALLLQGRTAQGEGLLRQAHHGYRDLGERLALSTCLHRLGLAAWQRQEPDEALTLLDEALRIRTELGLNSLAAETLELVGRVHEAEGRLPQAREAYETSLRAHDKRRPGVDASLRLRLGATLLKLGDLDAAWRNLESARSWLEAVPESPDLVQCFNLLAMVASWQDHAHHAARMLKRSASIARSVEDPGGEAFALAASALLLWRHNDADADDPAELLLQARAVRRRHNLEALEPLIATVDAVINGIVSVSAWDALPTLHRAWIERLVQPNA